VPLYSYQPRAGAPVGDSEDSAQIVPTAATVGGILTHIRKPPADRLELEARIASGGMGTIHVAVDHGLDRRIAIKTLHPHLRGDEVAVRMFLREARLTGLLDHPHIVPVYDLGQRTDDASLFFAMKLVEGQTLGALISSLPRGALDTATLYALLDVVTKVCDALAFAHTRGVLHCDVKPDNVMIGEFGQVFLMDWGIARLIAGEAPRESAKDSSIIGTPCYMSPEQARGDRQKLDVRSDVFLLGATLYEILTHRPPYSSVDRGETLALAAACAFPSPRKVAGEIAVPLELERIVMRCMAKDPAKRYPGMSELKADLVRFMRGGVEFPRRSYEGGEVIVREGEPGDEAYIVVEGSCAIRKELANGTQTIQTIKEGDVFGEMAILSPGPRTATVVAVAPTTVLVVTSRVLQDEMATLKPWMARLLTSLAERFRDADSEQRTTLANPALAPARIANQLLMHVTTWGADDGAGGRFMNWSQLASELEAQLGLAPIAVFGAIDRYDIVLDVEDDRLTITDVAALRTRIASDLSTT
jgi:serine/threonine-protein kinase